MVDVIGGSEATGFSGDILNITDLYAFLGITSPTATQTLVATAALRQAEGAVKRHLGYDPALSLRTEYYPRTDNLGAQTEGIWEATASHAVYTRFGSHANDSLQVMGLPVRQYDEDGANGIDLRIDYDGRHGTNSGFAADTLKTEGSDFWPMYTGEDSNGYKYSKSGILMSHGLWPTEAGSVKIIYMAGYTSTEFAGTDTVLDASPIRAAVITEATIRTHKYLSRQKGRAGWGVGGKTSESLGDYSYSADASSLKLLTGDGPNLSAESMFNLEPFVNYGIRLAS